jgi:hypothetical protein
VPAVVDIWELKPGDLIVTASGARARVKQASEDGESLLVEYLWRDEGDQAGEEIVPIEEIVGIELPAPDTAE